MESPRSGRLVPSEPAAFIRDLVAWQMGWTTGAVTLGNKHHMDINMITL